MTAGEFKAWIEGYLDGIGRSVDGTVMERAIREKMVEMEDKAMTTLTWGTSATNVPAVITRPYIPGHEDENI